MPARKNHRRSTRSRARTAAEATPPDASAPRWNDDTPPAAAAARSADGADALIQDAQAALADAATPKQRGGARAGAGRPSKAEQESAAAAVRNEETQALAGVLEPVFLALGTAVVHDMLKIDSPRWGNSQSHALAHAWSPVLVTQVKSPLTAAILATFGVSLPYVLIVMQRRAEQQQHAAERARVLNVEPASVM